MVVVNHDYLSIDLSITRPTHSLCEWQRPSQGDTAGVPGAPVSPKLGEGVGSHLKFRRHLYLTPPILTELWPQSDHVVTTNREEEQGEEGGERRWRRGGEKAGQSVGQSVRFACPMSASRGPLYAEGTDYDLKPNPNLGSNG